VDKERARHNAGLSLLSLATLGDHRADVLRIEARGRIEREVRAINGVEHVGWIFLPNKLWKIIKDRTAMPVFTAGAAKRTSFRASGGQSLDPNH